MKKKSLRPQQTAPVQRQIAAATSSLSLVEGVKGGEWLHSWQGGYPFAGDDAE